MLMHTDPSGSLDVLSPSGLGTRECTVAVVSPHDVVAIGLRAMLATGLAADRIGDVTHVRILGPDSDEEPDLVLYDVIALHHGDHADLDHRVTQTASTVVALTRPLRPDLGALALELGARAAVPVSASSEEVLAVVLHAADGTFDESAAQGAQECRLGAAVGLSRRETDVLRLVVQGRSNHEIAEELFLSINSVKTYIRSAYRKIGATSRPQVVSWCLRHGFPPGPL